MPRSPRVSTAGAIHHVLNRCNHQEHLLGHNDFQDLCALLLETKKRFPVRIFAYALLHNHYHLLLQEATANSVTKAMHWFNGVSAARYNIRHDIHGHLWQGRFKNRLLDSQNDRELLQCMVYIDLNPARAGLAKDIIDWPFCSARSHVERKSDAITDLSPIDMSGYEQLLRLGQQRTQQLHSALQQSDRDTVSRWVRESTGRSFIPYAKDISRLLGHNFRRLIPSNKTDVQKGQALPYKDLYKGA